MFSKIIWQTHELPYSELPDFQKNITNTWKYLNPEWQYIYVNAEERSKQVKKYDDFLYNCYLLLGKIHQADIWKLVATYEYGGVYADMDSICIKPIEETISVDYKQQQMMCSPIGFQNFGVNNSNFGAIKNSEIIKLILDSYILKYKDYGMNKLRYLKQGIPENSLFSNKILENQKFIYFNNQYFIHDNKYKTSFNTNEVHIPDFNGKMWL